MDLMRFTRFHMVSLFFVSFPHFLSLTLGTGAEKDARSTFGACSSEGASALLVWVSSHQSIQCMHLHMTHGCCQRAICQGCKAKLALENLACRVLSSVGFAQVTKCQKISQDNDWKGNLKVNCQIISRKSTFQIQLC